MEVLEERVAYSVAVQKNDCYRRRAVARPSRRHRRVSERPGNRARGEGARGGSEHNLWDLVTRRPWDLKVLVTLGHSR